MSQVSKVLGYWLRRAALANKELFTRYFSDMDLSMLQYGVLIVVGEQPGIAQKELTRILGAKSSVLVKPLDRMEGRGLIVRNRAAPDRRLQSITLTTAGRKLATRAEATTRKVQAVLLQGIEPDQQQILIESLGQIVLNVERMDD